MALTNAQIIARACSIAKAPGYAAQAGQYLNLTLQELCQTYDFDFIKKTQIIPLNSSVSYDLNTDNLRTKEVFYNVTGSPFYLFQIPIETYHALPLFPGVSSYPNKFAVDVSQTPKQLLPYPPPSIVQDLIVNYFPQMPDIGTPESDSGVAWFPEQHYLIKRVAAMVMMETDDERQPAFEAQAEKLLSLFLDLADDKEGFSRTVQLSRERFKTGGNFGPSKSFPLG